ncbi:MAG: NAD+ synthase [Candidatus Bathyarchaeota archaeon]|nr:NAD+ synthase [Candidatus Bathyarchaeota archaeon]
MKRLRIDPSTIQQRITHFIIDYLDKAQAKGIVMGISGGIDSATTAGLCSIAIGGERVLGIYMPEKESQSTLDYRHSKLLAKKFLFELKIIDITEVLGKLYNAVKDYDAKDRISQGNLKARARMIILYYYANHQNRIVVGSSDKSEAMLGYFTKWGDASSDIAPIMDLYKTQVRQLALHLGVPRPIVEKPSTPGLWPGQTAEKEIGLKYEILDQILYCLSHFIPEQTIASQLHLPVETIGRIKKRWLRAEHKRQMPLSIKLQYRTIGKDFRLSSTIDLGDESW